MAAVFRTSELHTHLSLLTHELCQAMNYYGRSSAKASYIKHERLFHIIAFKIIKGWSATALLTNMGEYDVSVIAKVWSLIRNELGLSDVLIDAIVNGTLPSRDTTHDGTPLKLYYQKQFEDGIRSNVIWIDENLNKTREELDAMEKEEHALLTKPGASPRLTLEDFNAHFKDTVFPDLKMLLLNNARKLSCMSLKERQKIVESKQMTDDEALLPFSATKTKTSSKKRKRTTTEDSTDSIDDEPITTKKHRTKVPAKPRDLVYIPFNIAGPYKYSIPKSGSRPHI